MTENHFEQKRLIDCMNMFSTRENTLRLGIELCRTLISYRNMGIYHRVITPAEVTVSYDGSIGISLVMPDVPRGDEFTSAIQLYVSPEYDEQSMSEASVVYSVGTIMYRLMNGNMEPFRNGTDYESARTAYIRRMGGTRPAAPSNADAPLSAIILKACEYDTSLRYTTISEMLLELKSLAEGSFQRDIRQDTPAEKSESGKKIFPFVISAISGIVISAIVLFCINFHYNDMYVRAERKLRDDKFSEARQMFEDMHWYKDSSQMILKCDYREAQYLAKNNKTEDALKIFEYLSDINYDESLQFRDELLLKTADELRADGKNSEAEEIMKRLSKDGSDIAAKKHTEHKYDTAMDMYMSGEYEEAKEIFVSLGDSDMATECDYSLGQKYMDDGLYAKAMGIFAYLDDFGNSREKFSLCEEWLQSENDSKTCKNYMGEFEDENGRCIKYIEENNVLRSSYNLAFTDGAYFKIDDGCHYHSRDGKDWKIQWIIQKTSSGIDVYNYIDKKTYTLKAQ